MLYESIVKQKIYNQSNPSSERSEVLFKFAEDIIKFATHHKLDYCFCGSISYMLYFGKAYRSLNDLDFKINLKQLKIWKHFIDIERLGPRKCRCKNPTMDTIDTKYIIYWNLNDKLYVAEMLLDFDKSKYTTININNQSINVTHPQAMINTKSRYSREKDFIDIEYYGLTKYKPE